MSASADLSDRQALYNSVLNSKDDESEHETTRSGDEDELHSELVKEYESNDTVGDSLKSAQLAKLVNKMFRCKFSEKNLKDRLERQERPANCEAAKPPKVNPGIWGRLREFTKKRDLQFYKIRQALIKGILPVARIADKLMTAKSANTEECQEMKKLDLEAMSPLTHASYEINMQRRLPLKPLQVENCILALTQNCSKAPLKLTKLQLCFYAWLKLHVIFIYCLGAGVLYHRPSHLIRLRSA